MNPPAVPAVPSATEGTLGRPNPFAFASETKFRFAILVVLALGVTFFSWNWLALYFQGSNGRYAEVLQRCSSALPDVPTGAVHAMAEAQTNLAICMQPLLRAQALTGLAGVALVVAGSIAIYWYLPGSRRRRRHLVPIEAASVSGLSETLEGLQKVAGVKDGIKWLLDPLNPRASGTAFGRLGDRCIILNRGLVAQYASDPAVFKAVVLHELSHIRNRDVDITYLTIATWWTFAVVTLVPLAATLVGQGWAFAARIGWRVLAIAVVVYLTRNAVLRSRELYADVRASSFPDGEALGRVFRSQGQSPRGWKALLLVHPSAADRDSILQDTAPLLRIGFWEALGAGLAATIVYNALSAGLFAFVGPGFDPLWQSWLVGLGLLPLAIWIVGLGTWRSVFSDLLTGRHTSVSRAGLGLGLGFVLGTTVGFDAAFLADGSPSSWARDLPVLALWGAFVVGLTWLQVRWIAMSARAWLGVALQHSTPRLITSTGLAAAAILTVGWLPVMLMLRNFAFGTGMSESQPGTLIMTLGVAAVLFAIPSMVLVGILLIIWLYPLVGLCLRQGGPPQPWWFLDPVQAGWEPAHPRGSIVHALRRGLVCGVAVVALLTLHRAGVHAFVAEGVRDTDEAIQQFLWTAIAIAAVGQGVAAGWTAAGLSSWRVVHGLLAATVTGLLAAGGILLGNGMGSCIDALSIRPSQGCSFAIETGFVWQVLGWVLRSGGIAALGSSLLVAALIRKPSFLPPGPRRAAPTTQLEPPREYARAVEVENLHADAVGTKPRGGDGIPSRTVEADHTWEEAKASSPELERN